MGSACSSCFKGEADSILTPDAVTRRKLQEEAAQRRQQDNASRGIKDPEKVRRQQLKAEELERREREADRQGNPTLKVNNIEKNNKIL